jgi:hypothetical protein
MRQFTALEATDFTFVLNGVDALETQLFAAADLLLPLAGREGAFLAQRFHPFQFRQGQFPLVFPMIRGVLLIERHIAV